jgi:hypothetical protein
MGHDLGSDFSIIVLVLSSFLCFLIQQENHEIFGEIESNISRKLNWKENSTLPWILRGQQTRSIRTRKIPSLFLKEKWRHVMILHLNNYFFCIIFSY